MTTRTIDLPEGSIDIDHMNDKVRLVCKYYDISVLIEMSPEKSRQLIANIMGVAEEIEREKMERHGNST